MSLASRRELLAVVAPRYRVAHGQERSRILEEFVASTGYHRKYALGLLNHPLTKAAVRKPRQRSRHYPFAVQQALIRCWQVANGICSKRLVPYLPELVAVLERVGELRLDADTKTRLLSLSAATADRLLQAERQRSKPHGLSTPNRARSPRMPSPSGLLPIGMTCSRALLKWIWWPTVQRAPKGSICTV
jgi:hypothetical protein